MPRAGNGSGLVARSTGVVRRSWLGLQFGARVDSKIGELELQGITRLRATANPPKKSRVAVYRLRRFRGDRGQLVGIKADHAMAHHHLSQPFAFAVDPESAVVLIARLQESLGHEPDTLLWPDFRYRPAVRWRYDRLRKSGVRLVRTTEGEVASHRVAGQRFKIMVHVIRNAGELCTMVESALWVQYRYAMFLTPSETQMLIALLQESIAAPVRDTPQPPRRAVQDG